VGGAEQAGGWDDRVWDRLVLQLRNGDCTPFLGAGACDGTLPLGAELAREWAGRYGYPFDDVTNLAAVMQHAGILEEDLVNVKLDVARSLATRGEPRYEDPTEPHSLLAGLPIRVYLTTNYDDFMTRALRRSGKEPVTVVCPWYRGAENDRATRLPDAYQPHAERPLVYHLHGSLHEPGSMVLAEQDYVEFLVNIGKDNSDEAPRLLPPDVQLAMTRQPLLFMGYSLNDWSFRVMFHGLRRAVPEVRERRHISVQLTPEPGMSSPEAQQRAADYLDRYLARLNIKVYWGSTQDFCAELRRRLESS
jgi:hypothetical protein